MNSGYSGMIGYNQTRGDGPTSPEETMRSRFSRSVEGLHVELSDIESLALDLEVMIVGPRREKEMREPSESKEPHNLGMLEALEAEHHSVRDRLSQVAQRLRYLSIFIG